MAEIFEKNVRQVGVVVTDPGRARAIGDPVRSAMIHILSKQAGSISDIKAKLEKQGISLAETTVRHHLDMLKKAGLVELTKLVDSRGGVLKYYAANVRLVEHRAPEDFDEKLEDAIKDASLDVKKFAEKLVKNYRREISSVAKSLKPCPHCSQEHFTEYVILEVLNRAIARASQEEDFKHLLTDVK